MLAEASTAQTSWHPDKDDVYLSGSCCICAPSLPCNLLLTIHRQGPDQNAFSFAFIQVRPLASSLFLGDLGGCLNISTGAFAAFPGCQKIRYIALSTKTACDAKCLIRLDLCISLAVSELSKLRALQLDFPGKDGR